MNEPMPVLHIAPTPFFYNRGCHIRIRNEVEALQSKGQRVIVCTYHHGHTPPGVDTRRIKPIPGYTKVSAGYSPYKFIADLLLLLLVLKVTLQEKPRLLHGHLHEGALIGWFVCRALFWRRLPLICDIQGSLSGELEAYGTFGKGSLPLIAFQFIEAVICRLPDLLFCSSVATLRLLKSDFGQPEWKIRLLPDVVPAAFFSPRQKEQVRHRLQLPTDRQIVIYSGSLLSGKGLDTVLNALLYFAAHPNPPFFLMVGYPVEPAAAFIKHHRLKSMCRLTGEVAYDQLPDWLAAADVALEPKPDSGGGEASGKLLHYMAAGLPIVAFDHAANRSLLGELGFWAPDGNQERFNRGIVTILSDLEAANARGQSGREIAVTRHSIDSITSALMDTYTKLEILRN